MNPIIVIPTFVTGHNQDEPENIVAVYDHMTPLNRQGELARCLASLRDHQIRVPVGIVVAASPGVEKDAKNKVEDITRAYPELDITVIDAEKENALHSRMVQMGLGDFCEGISLQGYGALRNMGLVMGAVGGYDMVIFIDDDEVVEDDAFLEKACYGMGGLTPKGIPILVKSGFYLDKQDSYRARGKAVWYNHYWQRHQGFNQWIDSAMQGPRLSRGNTLCGGLMAVHREAFERVSFDSCITRGEDLDYFLNLRMYGSEVWFDNEWVVRHLPPAERNEARRFRQEIYRWVYEQRKLEYAKSQVDLFQIPPQTLYPYPGPFLESSMLKNIRKTALLRSIGIPESRKGYFSAAMVARKEAVEYAQRYCADYFSFQYAWPETVAMLENDPAVQGIFEYGRRESLSGAALDEWKLALASDLSGGGRVSEAARPAERREPRQKPDRRNRGRQEQPTQRGDRIFEYYHDEERGVTGGPRPDEAAVATAVPVETEASPETVQAPSPSSAAVQPEIPAARAAQVKPEPPATPQPPARPAWAQAFYDRRDQRTGAAKAGIDHNAAVRKPAKPTVATASQRPAAPQEPAVPQKPAEPPKPAEPAVPTIDEKTKESLGEFELDLTSLGLDE